MPLDIPPVADIWLPPMPAIVRPIEHKLLRPGFLPASAAERRAALKELVARGEITPAQAKRAIVGFFVPVVGWGTTPFPIVEGVAVDVAAWGTTSFAMDLPAGITAGELILVCFFAGPDRGYATPSGFTELGQNVGDPNTQIWYKTAAGGETSATTSASPTFSAVSFAFRISNWSGTPTGTSAHGSANPPSHSPAGGSDDYLWIAFAGGYTTAFNASIGGYPTGYTGNQHYAESGGTTVESVGAVATKLATASSDDPSTFSFGGTILGTDAWTLAVAGL